MAFQRIGRTGQAKNLVQNALTIVRQTPGSEQRLRDDRNALDTLLQAKFDLRATIGFTKEMQVLANSMNTPNAVENQKYVADIIKNW